MRERDFVDSNLRNVEGIAHAKIFLSRLIPRFKRAQVWLDKRMNNDMLPYVAYRTGRLRNAVNAKNQTLVGTGKLCVYTLPYGRSVYSGVTKSGKKMVYSNPLTTPHWFETVKSVYCQQWIAGVKDVIKGR